MLPPITNKRKITTPIPFANSLCLHSAATFGEGRKADWGEGFLIIQRLPRSPSPLKDWLRLRASHIECRCWRRLASRKYGGTFSDEERKKRVC